MNRPDNNSSDNLESVTEDLPVDEEQSGEVKGGPMGDGSVRHVSDSIASDAWR